MITEAFLNKIEYDTKNNTAVVIDLDFIRDVRALMAENVELYATLDKTKKAVSDATKMLDEVLK